MSRALDAIERLLVSVSVGRLAHRLPDPKGLALIRAHKGLDSGAERPPPDDRLRELAQQLRAQFDPETGSRTLTPRQLRDVPWVLWSWDLATLPGLLDAVLDAARGRPMQLRRLIRAWLRDADPARSETQRAGRRLTGLVADGGDPLLAPWVDAQRRFALFDPALGPQAVARALIDGDRSVDTVLAEAGLGEPAVRSGAYVRAVVLAVLEQLEAALLAQGAAATWQRLVEPLVAPEDRLRFDDLELKGRLADAALSPWAAGHEPAAALRASIQRFLLRHLGDPRVQHHAWQRVRPEATAVLRRWLAGETLEAFFAVIDEFADPHWRYRRAFWLAALRQGAIADAWLVLGSNVARSAMATIKDAGDFATLEGGSGDRAALLMRIGGVVLAEWSHRGKLRAWPAGAASAPKLFRGRYSPDELMAPGLAFPGTWSSEGLVHRGAAQGRWQRRAAQFIHERTGIRLRREDWEL